MEFVWNLSLHLDSPFLPLPPPVSLSLSTASAVTSILTQLYFTMHSARDDNHSSNSNKVPNKLLKEYVGI